MKLLKQLDHYKQPVDWDALKGNAATAAATCSPIRQFYTGKSILVTGATGFIGKVLIEKLLYSCPEVEKIYLLIRSSPTANARERMLEMIAEKPFTMRLSRDHLLEKLVAIESDLSRPLLGLSAESRLLLAQQVSCIFHVAASVKFEAPLEVNLRHNVFATKQMLEFACSFKHLLCFVHVSTAYSNCQLSQIDERVYPMEVPEDPLSLREVTSEMIDNRPNTYTYTKAMAENVAAKYARKLNLAIVRPSIVMSALHEPSEGWIDTINGPVGLSVLGALGILQKIKVNSEVVFDLIPVDIVTNALLTIGWATTKHKHEFPLANVDKQQHQQHQRKQQLEEESTLASHLRVFNLTTGTENPCSFYDYFTWGRDEAYKKPSGKALRPLLNIPKQRGMNGAQYWMHKIFTHLLFAYLIDLLLSLLGQKRMVVKAVNRMHHANDVFDFFCSQQWTFATDNVRRLRQLQSPRDRVTFNCDVRAIDWNDYARVGWLGCRRHILKESDETFNYSKQRYKLICLLYYVSKMLVLLAAYTLTTHLIYFQALKWFLLMPIYAIVYLL